MIRRSVPGSRPAVKVWCCCLFGARIFLTCSDGGRDEVADGVAGSGFGSKKNVSLISGIGRVSFFAGNKNIQLYTEDTFYDSCSASGLMG